MGLTYRQEEAREVEIKGSDISIQRSEYCVSVAPEASPVIVSSKNPASSPYVTVTFCLV